MRIVLMVALVLVVIVVALAFTVLSGIVKCAQAQDESREDDLSRPDRQ